MANQFLLPDLGEGLTEAEIVSWLVAPGDVIEVDQLVVEVESSKSVVELPSPFGGRVEKLFAAEGDVVEKGAPLISVTAADQPTGPDLSAAPDQPTAPDDLRDSDLRDSDLRDSDLRDSGPKDGGPQFDAVPGTALRRDPPDRAAGGGSGAVLVGYGTKESTVKLKRPEGGRFGRRASGPSRPVSRAETAPRGAPVDPARRSPVVSPIVRKKAKDHGFDASQLVGTGPGSLVLRTDVDAAIAGLMADTEVLRDAPALPDPGATAAARSDDVSADLRIPIAGVRRVIAARLTRSRQTIPEATIWLDVDATELMAAKERLQKATGERYSLTALIARFVVAGLAQYPSLNSSVDDDAQEIVQHSAIHLGIAAQTSRGLMVPVIRDAHRLSTRELRDAIAELVAHSDKGDYPASALSGGTFTLNNYGGFGVDGSTPIINHPEAAMLGIGRMIDRAWVVDGQLAVRKVLVLTLVFDHRVCDGDVASGFLTFVAKCIEEPLVALTRA